MNEGISLRRAEPADAMAIAALTRAAYAKWVGVIGREPLPMGVDYEQALKAHRFDLLSLDGQLAGLLETTSDGENLLIVNVAIDPAFQGRGLGTRLLRFAETLAKDASLSGMRLYTNKRFTENLRLYAAIGYSVEREEPLNSGVAVHMSKPVL